MEKASTLKFLRTLLLSVVLENGRSQWITNAAPTTEKDFMKQSRISRIVQVLTALQSGQRYTVGNLATMLRMSRRTVYRDLRDLQTAGVPCYCDKKDRYYTIDPGFFLPAPDLSTQEALSLLLLVKARTHIHLPFKDSVLRAALKIESNLPAQIKGYCNTILQNISVKNYPQTKTGLLDKIFGQLQEAILKKRIVNIRYYLPREQKSVVTNLSPYYLMHSDHTWYVVGESNLQKGVCSFKLNQIKELNTLDKCFIKDEKFNVYEYLGRAWSMAPEGRLYNVRLRFLPEIAHSVAEVQWHSTQTATFEDDGSAIIEFRVDGLNEITWWILSYGDQVEVLSPRVLRKKIVEIAEKMVKTNRR
ncbi:MAG: WYL domain-containing protein [Desulfobacteraceae bacterium]|nr:WYL domain-containing protein [Desulfobacteraceae bacterium]